MNTEKRWRAGLAAAGLAFVISFTGCGGGDGGSGSGDSNNGAPNSLASHSYDLSQTGGGSTAVSFTSASDFTFLHTNGVVDHGSYTATQSANMWDVALRSDTGGQQNYTFNFASASNGTYTLREDGQADRSGVFAARSTAIPSGDTTTGVTTTGSTTTGTSTTGSTTTGSSTTGTTTTGTTTTGTTTTGTTTTGTTTTGSSTTGSTTTGSTTTGATTSGGTTTGSTTTGSTTTGTTTTGTTTTGTSTTGTTTTGSTTTGSTTTGPTSTDYTGFAPVSAAGRVMFGTRTFTSTGSSGQTHTYTFSSTTFHDADSPEESDGTYTYSANNSHATLNLVYTGPADFVGDKHNLTLNFTSKDNGDFTSTYTRGDGTVIVINGTFQFEPLP